MSEIRNELNEKVLEIKRLQIELNRREDEEAGNTVDSLRSQIADLKKENTTLKVEKNDLEAALEKSRESSTEKISPDASHIQNKDSLSEIVDSSRSSPGKEDMEQSIQKLNKDLSEARRERDKALQQLTRLKQHLLEKESEDSEKMDEDRKIIEELRESNEYLRAQTSHLEKALKQATANLEELKAINNNELQKSREIVDDLNKKLANCVTTIDAKNAELLNLQMALGQYYAEIEAKEHLDGELARAREELTNLSQQLKPIKDSISLWFSINKYSSKVLIALYFSNTPLKNYAVTKYSPKQMNEQGTSRGEKEEISAKLSQTEKTLAEWKSRVSKLEEDNAKLRRAVEQSMTRLNRMSVDSDFLVDRRIVIKLLVTYFQRNHSKEVLDLMVRMLGFSDEDKQRIGVAQQGSGKGVVRGVFGLPGRLVGGILGGSSTDSSASANAGSESQSFADMWVDFLLKETEERERRESAKDAGRSAEDSHSRSPHTAAAVSPLSNQRLSSGTTSGSSTHLALNQNSSPPPLGNLYHSENFGSEFSTVSSYIFR
ncbi:Golgin candidate 4 [Quillaja saponaria]|nr:Golgin candidate 4 [Quillaja saponaria]